MGAYTHLRESPPIIPDRRGTYIGLGLSARKGVPLWRIDLRSARSTAGGRYGRAAPKKLLGMPNVRRQARLTSQC
jgi:hypothetical protein